MEDRDFDRYFKGLAQHEVTESLPEWSEVSSRMSHIRRRKWIAAIASAASVAAAVVIALTIGLHVGNDNALPEIQMIQPAGLPDCVLAEVDVQDDIPYVADRIERDRLHLSAMEIPVQDTGNTDLDNETTSHGSIDHKTLDKIQLVAATQEDILSSGNAKERRKITFSLGGLTESSPFGDKLVTPANNRYHISQNSHLISPDINKRDTVIEKKSKSFSVPVAVGAGVRIPLCKAIDLNIGLNYTIMSRTLAGEFNGEFYTDINNTQMYIGIPVSLFFNIIQNERISVYAQLGGTVERGLSDKYKMNTAEGRDITHYESIHGVQLSLTSGLGLEYIVSRHIGIYLDPTLRYYFDNAQPRSIRTHQQLQCGFEMGLRIRL